MNAVNIYVQCTYLGILGIFTALGVFCKFFRSSLKFVLAIVHNWCILGICTALGIFRSFLEFSLVNVHSMHIPLVFFCDLGILANSLGAGLNST